MSKSFFILDKNLTCIAILSPSLPDGLFYFDDIHVEALLHGLKTLEFSIVGSGEKANLITTECYVVYPNLDDEYELFNITEIVESNKDNQYTKKVFCENAAVPDLLGTIIRPDRLMSYTLEQAMGYVLNGTGWNLGVAEYVGVQDFDFSDYITSLEATHKILEAFQAEIRFTIEFQNLKVIQKKIDVVQKRGTVTKKPFVYGLNLQEVTREEDTKELVTALIGVGRGSESGETLTFINYNPTVESGFEKNYDWVGSLDAFQQFGNGRHIFGVYRDDKAQNQVELYNNTLAELKKRCKPSLTYTVSVVDLERLTGYESHKVRIGDTITIQDKTFTPTLALEARIIEKRTSYSSPDPSKNIVVLGDYKTVTPPNKRIQELQSIIQENRLQWMLASINAQSALDSTLAKVVDSLTLYVDPELGDDDNDGLSTTTQKQTIQGAVDSLPSQIDNDVSITVKDIGKSFVEPNIYIDDFSGVGSLSINFPTTKTTTLNSRIYMRNCDIEIKLNNVIVRSNEAFSQDMYVGVVQADRCKFVILKNCYVDARAGSRIQYGIFSNNSHIRIDSCESYNASYAQVEAANNGTIDLYGAGCKGSGGRYGVSVNGASIIGGAGTYYPNGTNGSVDKPGGGLFVSTGAVDGGTAPGAPSTKLYTLTYSPTLTKSWRNKYGGWRTDNNNIYQGEYSGYGNHKGCLFFDFTKIKNDLTGNEKSNKTVRLYLERIKGGIESAQSINIYSHNLSSTSGEPALTTVKLGAGSLAVNRNGWINLPVSVANSFKAGSIKGLAVYASSGSPYMVLSPNSKLEIVYEGP